MEELADHALPRGKNGACNDISSMTAALALIDDEAADVRRAAIQVVARNPTP